MPNDNKEWFDDELGMLVRDVTQVGSIPKSTAKRRIKELLVEATRRGKIEGLKEALDVVYNLQELGTQNTVDAINSCIQQYGKEE